MILMCRHYRWIYSGAHESATAGLVSPQVRAGGDGLRREFNLKGGGQNPLGHPLHLSANPLPLGSFPLRSVLAGTTFVVNLT